MKTENSKPEIFKNDQVRLIDPISRVQILSNDGGMLSNKKRQLKTVRTIHHLRGDSYNK